MRNRILNWISWSFDEIHIIHSCNHFHPFKKFSEFLLANLHKYLHHIMEWFVLNMPLHIWPIKIHLCTSNWEIFVFLDLMRRTANMCHLSSFIIIIISFPNNFLRRTVSAEVFKLMNIDRCTKVDGIFQKFSSFVKFRVEEISITVSFFSCFI